MEASDLHLTQGGPAMVRVDGSLRALSGPPPDLAAALEGLLGEAQLAALKDDGAVDLAVEGAEGGRCRLNVYRHSGGLACAVRLLRRAAPRLDSLGLPMHLLEPLVALPSGLLLVCGPTGSGKSTTLAALCQEVLSRRGGVLVTLEDPIEYRVPAPGPTALVRQREVGRDVRDFATGLRAALREDPDVLLIGEMRDPESIALVLTAAETGHLVLATLHSPSATGAIERIADAFAPERQQQIRVQLADCLQAVVVQRLIPTVRGGRLPVVEVLRGTHRVRNMIREGHTERIPTAIQAGGDEGMLALERALADRVLAGTITEAAARAVANEPGSLDTYLHPDRAKKIRTR
ncbi:MAG: PilT/PilU family type 4a pilus ATPase [Alphaproteobacteria bacterium]|nr:PilT/PilU family type 4a pilus ATPase [Alphaproteobacteria bacterium]